MKKIIFFVFTILITLFTYAQEEQIYEAPISKAFVEYMAKKNGKTTIPKYTSKGFVLGKVPSTFEPDFSTYNSSDANQKSMQVFAPVYDMRTNGKITSVKDQGDCGSCWLFPIFGSIESNWKIAGLGTFDLSEDNLKNCHGFDYGPCDGGSREMAVSYFTRNSGPVLESQDPYSASSVTCPTGLTPAAYVSDARFFPKNKNTIKQALLDYGAIENSFHWDDAFFNETDFTYFYGGTSNDLNHAVLLVGWDDNKVTAGGTGAWIIKNSWGNTWADNGFFYVSYNDTRILSDATCYPVRVNYDVNSKVSYYDHLGMTTSFGFGGTTGYGMVKYVPQGNEQITKVGTWVVGSNATVTVQIYSTLTGSTLSTLLGSIPAKSCVFPGYYTFDLPTPINITAGDDYYIKIKYTTPGENFPVPIETKLAGYSTTAVIESGKCWISGTGSSWTAVGSNTTKKFDVCIKSFSKTSACVGITSASASPANALACIGGSTILTVTSNVGATGYQWQQSNTGASWNNLVNTGNYSNVTTSSLTISSVAASLNNKKYRCVVSNACSTVNSSIVILNTNNSPVVTNQPINKTISLGANTSFTFSATGSGKTYQWQVSSNNGSTWSNLSNANVYSNVTTITLNITGATIALNNKKYRCVITNLCGTVNTNAAKLNVLPNKSLLLNEEPLTSLPLVDENIQLYVSELDKQEASYFLGNNYPNPFLQLTKIDYSLSEDAMVTIEIYNVVGKQIAVLVNKINAAGNYQIEFDGAALPAGYYTYTMKAIGKNSAFSQTRMMVISRD